MKSLPHVVCLLALASCVPTADASKGVIVELASVTLADECGPPPAPPPPPNQKFSQPPPKEAPATPPVPARPAKPSDSPHSVTPGFRGHCNQTSMQLTIQTPSGNPPAIFQIKTVELLDDKGKLLQVLTARSPRTWAESQYRPWDQTLSGGVTLKAMFDLTTPDWNKLTNGRWNAHSKAFQVRVTVTVGNTTKTVERQSITPVRLPPAVPT